MRSDICSHASDGEETDDGESSLHGSPIVALDLADVNYPDLSAVRASRLLDRMRPAPLKGVSSSEAAYPLRVDSPGWAAILARPGGGHCGARVFGNVA